MRISSVVEPEWLFGVCPEYFCEEEIEDGEVRAALRAVAKKVSL